MIAGTEGDQGDALAVCCILHGIGGCHKLLLEPSKVTKGLGNLKPIIPLIHSQPYIEECRNAKAGDLIEWHSGGFRGMGTHSPTSTLVHAHLAHFNRVRNTQYSINGSVPWLFIEPSQESKGRVVINRTFRYRNNLFPWKRVVEFYAEKLLFIGMPNEHEDFCNNFGPVAYQPTKDFLEAGKLIAGSDLFIGNQSCAGMISHGLHHPMISEVALHIPDCIYKRENAQYCYNGAVTLPGLGKEDLTVPPVRIVPERPSMITCPPGKWQYRGLSNYSATALIDDAKRTFPEEDASDLLDRVLQDNVMRCPEFFIDQNFVQQYKRVEQARLNAGYEPREFREILGL